MTESKEIKNIYVIMRFSVRASYPENRKFNWLEAVKAMNNIRRNKLHILNFYGLTPIVFT